MEIDKFHGVMITRGGERESDALFAFARIYQMTDTSREIMFMPRLSIPSKTESCFAH